MNIGITGGEIAGRWVSTTSRERETNLPRRNKKSTECSADFLSKRFDGKEECYPENDEAFPSLPRRSLFMRLPMTAPC